MLFSHILLLSVFSDADRVFYRALHFEKWWPSPGAQTTHRWSYHPFEANTGASARYKPVAPPTTSQHHVYSAARNESLLLFIFNGSHPCIETISDKRLVSGRVFSKRTLHSMLMYARFLLNGSFWIALLVQKYIFFCTVKLCYLSQFLSYHFLSNRLLVTKRL